jgi:hypothetical protein
MALDLVIPTLLETELLQAQECTSHYGTGPIWYTGIDFCYLQENPKISSVHNLSALLHKTLMLWTVKCSLILVLTFS